jgi:glutamate dehydrogenase
MEQQMQDLRAKTLELVLAAAGADATERAPHVTGLIKSWLDALDEADLSEGTPHHLAAILWAGFSQLAKREGDGCQIASMLYPDGRGGHASALLILNQDMPYLVDSLVMALRKRKVAVQGVLNAVLSVSRVDGVVSLAESAASRSGPLESYVLVLLANELDAAELDELNAALRMVAADAAMVRRDSVALAERMSQVGNAAGARGAEGQEVSAFMEWAKSEGFEAFGYAYYRVNPGQADMVRDIPSRIGVLRDQDHPVYGTCLANIPGDYATLSARPEILSVVKADVQGTLHRDQRLDFIGVRDTDANGTVIGEHCFVGLFTRAATSNPAVRLPIARQRVAKVLQIAGVRPEGFRAEKFQEVLDSLPRTELMEADANWLAQVCSQVVSLYKQPRTRVFARRDVYNRHLNVLVYLPRERFSASLVEAMSHTLKAASGASEVRSQTLVADGPLARLYLIANAARLDMDLEHDIGTPLLTVMDGWHSGFERLSNSIADRALRNNLRKLTANLPADYIASNSPAVALRDLQHIVGKTHGQPVTVATEVEFDSGLGEVATIRLYSADRVPPLSHILPALHNAGVSIDREKSYSVNAPDGTPCFITCLQIDAATANRLGDPQVAEVAEDMFARLFNGEAEDGRLNGLVLDAGLHAREVQLLRAYISYWRQAGARLSVRYIADCLRKQPALARELIHAFLQRFDPALPEAERAKGQDAMRAVKAKLSEVNHADTELVLASVADLMLATLRTSYFQKQQPDDTIIFKFDSTLLPFLPEPRPYREIFVFSRRFEGVHLRGGPVARGGLRWSDRMEDYRTEVLGLVKAQMVKNAVIVPAGAKGGFVCKMMPKNAAREVIAAEGEAVYRLFIGGLLDLTDNRDKGAIIHPQDTVCYDGTDPYLVVAADKGTATFSDIANGIAVSRGFWLGDAFASGGSNGYDHKKLGITAKGAWEAVKRHFYEMHHNMDVTPITMVGIGDMSGDVFGNGVLLSRQLKLVAAFDHRHIFIDPNPDVAVSFEERARMFALPRSSWDDYDKSKISSGGGVWPRSVRSIELSHAARSALGIDAESLSPEELMHQILLAPVDLFYNGGIGTYIKASSETHAQVKDRANDAIRVDGNQLRCKVVAEGGNLGATQAGRIEFALAGGRIFTDAIDNSAGVDCSDHEVNAKIWLDVEVNAGQLTEAERNRILNDMTLDIEQLVLRDNRLQTQLLTREMQAQSHASTLDAYADLIEELEAEGALSRELEQLPSSNELARRKADGLGLVSSELAVVLANVKNRFKRQLGQLPLTEQAWAEPILKPYFPASFVATRNALDHPLANAILATVLANEAVNRCGPLMIASLARGYGVPETEVLQAWAQGWAALNLTPVFDVLDNSALLVPPQTSIEVDQRTRALQRAMIEGVLSVDSSHKHHIDQLAHLFAKGEMLASLTGGEDHPAMTGLPKPFVAAWKTIDALAQVAAFLFASLSVARPDGLELPAFLHLGMALRRAAGIDALEHGLKQILPEQAGLRDYASQALHRAQQRLLSHVLHHMQHQADGHAAVAQVVAKLPQAASHAHASHEQVMLQVWALSEAAHHVAAPSAKAA